MSEFSLARLREDEIRYRERGRFELANQRRMQADLLEAGGDPNTSPFSFIDRGIIESVRYGSIGSLTGFLLPSGLAWVLTKDRLFELFDALIEALDVTPEDLTSLAIMLAEERALKAGSP